jgi:hypothetical protein
MREPILWGYWIKLNLVGLTREWNYATRFTRVRKRQTRINGRSSILVPAICVWGCKKTIKLGWIRLAHDTVKSVAVNLTISTGKFIIYLQTLFLVSRKYAVIAVNHNGWSIWSRNILARLARWGRTNCSQRNASNKRRNDTKQRLFEVNPRCRPLKNQVKQWVI